MREGAGAPRLPRRRELVHVGFRVLLHDPQPSAFEVEETADAWLLAGARVTRLHEGVVDRAVDRGLHRAANDDVSPAVARERRDAVERDLNFRGGGGFAGVRRRRERAERREEEQRGAPHRRYP